ncbi:conserved hypothetical protein [Talaromyces stipitatus ATCC 10500]|uniref:Trafficking PGA2 n=1 Tax=Talaromyces stipitatus (strain ATCC 10500 / CBS 375.48 / QM 6759 / NRRL 1006) TaxID=441959 RepID=B8MQN2_TALSN|nr:uncharacterized protein TSTA_059410 [Talaromyces stipitatus ATCC 10500]EED13455.1 conserved hypothetical protein [Talaromyces stipitatus ATCC 10500]
MTTTDPTAFLYDLLQSLNDYALDSLHDFQDYVGRPKVRHWLRIIVIVFGYIMVRPAIELFFKKMFERQAVKEEEAQKKKREEEDAQLVSEGLKRPKKDGNSLRIGTMKVDDNNKEKEEKGVKSEKGDSTKTGRKAVTLAAGNERDKDNKTKDEDYENSDQEDFAEKIRASGVLEWGRDARKRKQRQQPAVLEAEQQQKQMDEEKLMELLDWSDDEGKQ